MRQFMILEILPGCYLRIVQFVQVVIRQSLTGLLNRDAVFECQICINVPEFDAYDAGGHD